MSEAELVEAFLLFTGLTNQLLFGYVSLLSGFIVMSYLIADKISSFLVSISVALFSIVSALLFLGIYLSRNNAGHIMALMRAPGPSGKVSAAWLGSNPQWAGDVMSALYLLAALGGYFGAIAYFFHTRRHGNHVAAGQGGVQVSSTNHQAHWNESTHYAARNVKAVVG